VWCPDPLTPALSPKGARDSGTWRSATQNQALNALVFLYRQVIGGELGWLDANER